MQEVPIAPHIALINTQRRLLNLYRVIWAGLALTVLAVIAAAYWIYHRELARPSDPPGVQTPALPEAAPACTLMDQCGRLFTQTQLQGKWTIMFFSVHTHKETV